MTRTAIYPGSFDPPTRGHESVIRRSLAFCDRLIVAVAAHPTKSSLFTVAERLDLLRAVIGSVPEVRYLAVDGLLAETARREGATLIVRGLRVAGDFEYELQMALMNRQLHPGAETVFLAPVADQGWISSSLVREVARYGGDVSTLVHPAVVDALRARFSE
jgi:pantetheine-phosphate adenylyltransferase